MTSSWKPRWVPRRRARTEAAVLGCLVLGDIYHIEMWTRIGGNASHIYATLVRLESLGWVWSERVEQPSGPPRRRYRLTKLALATAPWGTREHDGAQG